MISRSDNWGSSRQSITAITSTWSDGSQGPLGLCYPSGSFKQAEVDKFNAEFKGVAYMFESETRSHFMTGETFQVLLHGMVTDAYFLKRKALGVSTQAKGMLLADAWSGFHCWKTGISTAREAWALSCNVKLPSLQAG